MGPGIRWQYNLDCTSLTAILTSNCYYFGPILVRYLIQTSESLYVITEKDVWKLIWLLQVYSSETYSRGFVQGGLTEEFKVSPRAWQGCAPSPLLFNYLAGWMCRSVLGDRNGEPKSGFGFFFVLFICWQFLASASDLECNQTQNSVYTRISLLGEM